MVALFRQTGNLTFGVPSAWPRKLESWRGEASTYKTTPEDLLQGYSATQSQSSRREFLRTLESAYSNHEAILEDVLKLSRQQKDKEAYAFFEEQLQPAFQRFLDLVDH